MPIKPPCPVRHDSPPDGYRPAGKRLSIAAFFAMLAASGTLAFGAGSSSTGVFPRWMGAVPTVNHSNRPPLPAATPTLTNFADPPDAARDTARRSNGRERFVPDGLVIAPPFQATMAPADRQRAVDCLAAASYYEAGTGASDQRAVVQVVLNRLRHPAFPHTVCGVIFQGSERSTGCQFTFTCDGALARRQPSPLAWRQAQQVAEEALQGHAEAAVGQATHYHTDWVFPAWSGQMDKIAAVKTHLFFRWRGGWGASAAFSARYAGGEPRIPGLAHLSFAHRGEPPVTPPGSDAQPAPPMLASAPVTQGATIGERLPDHVGPPDADVFLVTLDANASSDELLRLAERACGNRDQCRFIGWTNAGRKARQLPMPGSAIDAISFSFIRHNRSEPDTARWNCSEFPRSDRNQCLRRGA